MKVHDRVEKGEMPPKDMPRPDAKKAADFVSGMSAMLSGSEEKAMAGEGRSTQRRMNRYEYENALRDLLHVPTAQIMNRLPQDGEAYRFNKSAEALDVSYVQMSRFMSSADYAMRMAMAEALGSIRKCRKREVVMAGWAAELAAAGERDAAGPAEFSGVGFAGAAGCAGGAVAGDESGDAGAGGGGAGIEHIQRCGGI